MIDTRPIDTIKVGERIRTDLGDLDALSKSIDENGGLLQPILIRSDGTLIAGERRLAACRHLGRSHVEVNVRNDFASDTALLIAERDENTCRKDFTPSEAVHMGRRLEALLQEDAKEKQREAGKEHGRGIASGESPKAKGGPINVRKSVSAAVGLGETKYDHAKKVVEAADDGDPVAEEAIAEMDRTGKVEPAYRKVIARPESPLKTKTDAAGRQQPTVRFGKGDKWQEASEPLTRYLAGWEKRGFEFAHINYREAAKRVERINALIAGLESARADLEPRSQKAKLSL